jgi:hypothetical protein
VTTDEEAAGIESHLRNPTELKAEQLHEALAKTHRGLLDELVKRDEAWQGAVRFPAVNAEDRTAPTGRSASFDSRAANR